MNDIVIVNYGERADNRGVERKTLVGHGKCFNLVVRNTFKADLPGLKKEEVKVEIEDNSVLQISGERDIEKEDKNDQWHRVERSSGKFMRRFRLPENAKMDQIKANMENGVLTVTIPKEEVEKPEVKTIEISG
ncbi:class I heat shock protein-like [Vicia villosa]|uniref:class I heat shock protein-like n=1 Tax=Vicia villosa TaxID=3911 RepID=UPI00273AF0D2|nr:class I heat shock protein-like [Vicia villosa]